MKILHVTQNYYPSVGGTQHTIKKISEIFVEEYNDSVIVLTSNSLYGPNRQKFEEIALREEVLNGVTVKRHPFLRSHIPLIKLWGKFLSKAFKKPLPDFLISLLSGPISRGMVKDIKSTDADVIGASSIHYRFADYPQWRKHTTKPKPFVMYGALHLHDTKLLPLYIERAKTADYYIANTLFEKNYLIQQGLDEKNIKVIGAGSDILEKADFSITDDELRRNYDIAKGDIIITYIGRQEAFKGIPVLAEAYSSLGASFKNIHLFICGAVGAYTEELKKIIEINKGIRLLSNITDRQKTEILRVTDILVLPSKEESFGVVFLEAWSFSKPVVGAGIGAVASLIEEGKDGLLFKPDDVQDLADKLRLLVENEPLRKELGENGKAKYLANYTWDAIAKKFRDVYQLAINKFTLEQSRQ